MMNHHRFIQVLFEGKRRKTSYGNYLFCSFMVIFKGIPVMNSVTYLLIRNIGFPEGKVGVHSNTIIHFG